MPHHHGPNTVFLTHLRERAPHEPPRPPDPDAPMGAARPARAASAADGAVLPRPCVLRRGLGDRRAGAKGGAAGVLHTADAAVQPRDCPEDDRSKSDPDPDHRRDDVEDGAIRARR